MLKNAKDKKNIMEYCSVYKLKCLHYESYCNGSFLGYLPMIKMS